MKSIVNVPLNNNINNIENTENTENPENKEDGEGNTENEENKENQGGTSAGAGSSTEEIEKADVKLNLTQLTINLAETNKKLYIKAMVESAQIPGHQATAVIEDDHDNIAEIWYDNSLLASSHRETAEEPQKCTLDYGLTVKEIFDFDEVIETVAGSIITSHCGKGTLGVLFVYNK